MPRRSSHTSSQSTWGLRSGKMPPGCSRASSSGGPRWLCPCGVKIGSPGTSAPWKCTSQKQSGRALTLETIASTAYLHRHHALATALTHSAATKRRSPKVRLPNCLSIPINTYTFLNIIPARALYSPISPLEKPRYPLEEIY